MLPNGPVPYPAPGVMRCLHPAINGGATRMVLEPVARLRHFATARDDRASARGEVRRRDEAFAFATDVFASAKEKWVGNAHRPGERWAGPTPLAGDQAAHKGGVTTCCPSRVASVNCWMAEQKRRKERHFARTASRSTAFASTPWSSDC